MNGPTVWRWKRFGSVGAAARDRAARGRSAIFTPGCSIINNQSKIALVRVILVQILKLLFLQSNVLSTGLSIQQCDGIITEPLRLPLPACLGCRERQYGAVQAKTATSRGDY